MKNFSPNLVILVIVLVLVGVSAIIFFGRKNNQMIADTNNELPTSTESPTLAASAEYTSTDSADPENFDSAGDSSQSGSTGSPLPSPAPLTNYTYPGAKVVSSSANKIEMTSSQDPAKITNWYKEKIRTAGFNAKSFTQTTTNGVILNKLSAAKPGEKIDVTIKKDQTGSNVSISVDRP